MLSTLGTPESFLKVLIAMPNTARRHDVLHRDGAQHNRTQSSIAVLGQCLPLSNEQISKSLERKLGKDFGLSTIYLLRGDAKLVPLDTATKQV